MEYKTCHYLLVITFLFTSNTQAIHSPKKLKTVKPAIELASRYHHDIQISNYLVSEKLDGVRARWNGEALITRGGHFINAPKWFTHGFPKQALDGELWIGRNRFDEASGIIRNENSNDKWKLMTFNVFDLPLSREPFLKRYQEMQNIINENSSPYIVLIEQKTLASKLALNRWLNKVESLHGEGLMLHHKDSLYEHKRSKALLKLKKIYDAEAVVISHLTGKGKYKHMLGAMMMEMPNGIRFKLGSGLSDALRRNPPKIGATVTYQFYGLTKNGKPRFASYLRLRENINSSLTK